MRLRHVLHISLFLCSSVYADEKLSIVTSTDPLAFDDAQHLLHKVYVEEGGWLPKGDPTGIRVSADANGRLLLVNDYDQVALRFNALLGETIVGTVRMAGSINGKFEVEHYLPLPPLLQGMKAASLTRMFDSSLGRTPRKALYG